MPTTSATVASAMDAWEAANGLADLYDELVAHLGKVAADDLWDQACRLYNRRTAQRPTPAPAPPYCCAHAADRHGTETCLMPGCPCGH